MNRTTTTPGSRATEKFSGPRAAGRIRCGTKVLTTAALQNPQVVTIYAEGLAAWRRSSLIEKEIVARTNVENPMRPVNTREFHLCADDFDMAILPEAILDLYGEDVDGRRVLNRFPVFFHSNELFDFFPHRFESHAGPEKFRSAFDAAGERVCEHLPVPRPKATTAPRATGGHRMAPREWAQRGLCDPGVCKEFQSGQCQFHGRLKFYVPGVVGLGLVEMETSAEYATGNIWSTLDEIRKTLGYVPHFNPNDPGKPVFWITKVQEPRTYFDEQGKERQGPQWVPRIVPAIDLPTMLRLGRTPMPAATPPAWLATPGGSVEKRAHSERSAQSVPLTQTARETSVAALARIDEMLKAAGINRTLFLRYTDSRCGTGWRNKPAQVEAATEALGKIVKYGQKVDVYLETRLIPSDYRIDPELFAQYAKKAYGEWERNFTLMGELIARVRSLFEKSHEAGLAAMRAACPEAAVES